MTSLNLARAAVAAVLCVLLLPLPVAAQLSSPMGGDLPAGQSEQPVCAAAAAC